MRKYSRINKNRKSGKNRSYLRMKKERKDRFFSFAGVKLQLKLNNRGDIVDVQPRLEGLLDRVSGRPFQLQDVKNILRNVCVEFANSDKD